MRSVYYFLLILCNLFFAEVNANVLKSLPLPRFASLRSNAVNLHVGPGKNYPIEWKFVRQSLPVEIIAEFDNWRKIRDHQGTVGWVHKSLLSGKRTVFLTNAIHNMHANPDANSKVVAKLEPGVIINIIELQPQWCKVEIKAPEGRYKGWVKRQNLWGIYNDEISFG